MSLQEAKAHAEQLLGVVEWDADGLRGLCRCPGAELHTQRNARRDCIVFLEGAPTISCFHSSCASTVEAANKQLRRRLGSCSWEIVMPGGAVVRNGEWRPSATRPSPLIEPSPAVLTAADRITRDTEKKELLDLQCQADAQRALIFRRFAWSQFEMMADSPTRLADDTADDWHQFLGLWHPDDVIWCGDTYNSGRPEHADNFRTARDWMRSATPPGEFTCGTSFQPGTFSRSNTAALRHRFLVVESDTLTREEVGAVFKFMRERLQHRLFAVVDTGGKSLHGWFSPPHTERARLRLKATLTGLGCDPALFKSSQPVRVPGIRRADKDAPQKLVWRI